MKNNITFLLENKKPKQKALNALIVKELEIQKLENIGISEYLSFVVNIENYENLHSLKHIMDKCAEQNIELIEGSKMLIIDENNQVIEFENKEIEK